jgi:type IV pilus assembly protein PilN
MIRTVEASELLTEPLLEFIEAGANKDTMVLSDFKMHLRVKGYEAVQGSHTPAVTATAGGQQ